MLRKNTFSSLPTAVSALLVRLWIIGPINCINRLAATAAERITTTINPPPALFCWCNVFLPARLGTATIRDNFIPKPIGKQKLFRFHSAGPIISWWVMTSHLQKHLLLLLLHNYRLPQFLTRKCLLAFVKLNLSKLNSWSSEAFNAFSSSLFNFLLHLFLPTLYTVCQIIYTKHFRFEVP